ncbi:MAG TPA: hypothetical protein VFX16_10750 [Pseudonocardiaceae bacterium]|nr:hypothetical protein [Pseudonocardiaceae bacterium]
MDSIPSVNRRNFLVVGSLATAATALQLTGGLATIPNRANADTLPAPSDIQFDVGAFCAPPQTMEGIIMAMPPVHTIHLTAQLLRRPNQLDQIELTRVLSALESAYPWGAAGLVTFVSYGLPYFQRLDQSVVTANMPRLSSDPTRFVLEEAMPSGSDVFPGGRTSKMRYNVSVNIEHNDMLFMLRSDNADHLQDAVNFLSGQNSLAGQPVRAPRFGGLLEFTSSRAMFVQQGLPRSVADQDSLPYNWLVNPDSPMWMGFFDQHTNGAGPPQICTFAGNSSAHLTSAVAGDYFDNGAIQHLSHNIIDMLQWFNMLSETAPPGADGTYEERVQYMFHAPAINPGNDDQFTNGGGPAILQNENRGPLYAEQTAQGIGIGVGNDDDPTEPRVGHLSALQRSSRAADGTPIHIRMDGPGYDNMDVPDGSVQPKLQFTIFVPTSDFFLTMRANAAAADLMHKYNMAQEDNGLERFITATRRQNYLNPPRRHRAFPLVEIGG